MAERAGWNTGPFDLRIWIFLVNKRKIQINVSERTLGDCQSDAGFHQRGRRSREAPGPVSSLDRVRGSNAPALECQTPGVASNSSANELDIPANLCSNVLVFE